MKTYTYAYGHGSKSFSLPEDAVIKEIEVASLPVIEDVAAAALEMAKEITGPEPRFILMPMGSLTVPLTD